jgi:hypothetical protein
MTETLYKETPETTISADTNITSYEDLLVGEGKKFTNAEALARAKYESDRYIEQLKRENKELRVDLNGRANLEQLVSELQKTGTSTSTRTDVMGEQHSDSTPVSGTATAQPVTKETIAELVKSIVTDSKTQDARANNIDRCVRQLQDAYGDSYVNKLEETSKKLNLSKKYLDDLAATSPEALLQLVGAPAPKVSVTAPRTSVQSTLSSQPKGGQKDWAYYQNLRKTNSREYFSTAVQNEIHQRVLRGELDVPSN